MRLDSLLCGVLLGLVAGAWLVAGVGGFTRKVVFFSSVGDFFSAGGAFAAAG